MIGRVIKMSQPNSSIRCTVNTCDYYGSGNQCYAKEIEVNTKVLANTSEMTDCATFFPKIT